MDTFDISNNKTFFLHGLIMFTLVFSMMLLWLCFFLLITVMFSNCVVMN